MTAAITSLVLFAIRALVPVLPSRRTRCSRSVAITGFTGRPVLASGGRQLALGLAAAGLMYAIGRVPGIAFS
ncbi:MAG: hypothetical protein M3680_05665 [Myxococcota bacterium]|nr:hypothetical protein [Myxococcota bacterium]